MKRASKVLEMIFRVFFSAALVVFILGLIGFSYYAGYVRGTYDGGRNVEYQYSGVIPSLLQRISYLQNIPRPTPKLVQPGNPSTGGSDGFDLIKNTDWGGPQLWDAVNIRRQELGVNPLNQADDLCTIASIRLNEQLELGKLDGHAGFGDMAERRPDLAHIFENYGTVAEFLAAGPETAEGVVELWENSLGHKKIVTGGEYVWGCIYAQNSFAVAITAY